jgi:YggT family protein
MTDDRTLEIEEGRRIDQYDAMKNTARSEIQEKARQQAEELTPNEQGRVEPLGNKFKDEAITEVQQTEREVKRARGTARTSQIIDYIFYLIYVVVGLRIVFDLFGARESNAFDNFIDAISAPFLAPFRNLFPDPVSGRFQLRFSYLAALGIYVVLHLTINGFLRMLAHRKTEV